MTNRYRLCVRSYTRKHQTHTYLNDYAKSLVPLEACGFGGYLLIVTICLHCMSKQKEKWKAVWREKIKCVGEALLGFDKGFSQHPSVSLGWGQWPNITFHQSYLNDRQTLSNKGFFSNASFYCSLPRIRPSCTEWLKPMGVRLEKRNRVRKRRQHSSRCWVPQKKMRRKEKKEKVEVYPACYEHTTLGLKSICVLNISKVWATRGGEQYCTRRTVAILYKQ